MNRKLKLDPYTIARLHLAERIAGVWDKLPPYPKFLLVAWLAVGAAYVMGR